MGGMTDFRVDSWTFQPFEPEAITANSYDPTSYPCLGF